MVRIAISVEAFEAIVRTPPLGSVAVEAEANERGERLIWLEAAMADRLGAMRGPGESFSDPADRGVGRHGEKEPQRGDGGVDGPWAASWPSSPYPPAIVAAAAKLIESVGANGFSLRKLAKALGVGPTTIHFHFEGGVGSVFCALTDRNCEGFCHPGNWGGLPGLDGGGCRNRTDGHRSLASLQNEAARKPVRAIDPTEWAAFRTAADGGRAPAKRRRKHVTLDAPVSVSSEESPVIRWLMTDGRRITDPKSFLENFAMCLIEAGVDVSQITTGVPVLHPQLYSYSGLWELGGGRQAKRPQRFLSVGDPAMYAVYAFIRRSNMLIAIALKTCCRAASTESAATACLLERF